MNETKHNKHWTAAEEDLAERLIAKKKTWKEISETLGRHPQAIYGHMRWGSKYAKARGLVAGIVSRACLRCEKTFMAKGRFNRLCENCTDFARRKTTSLD